MVTFFIVLAVLAVADIGYTVYKAWVRATGTVWARLLATSRNSATILWARFVTAVGFLSTSLAGVAEYLNAPEVKEYITAALKPEYVGPAVVIIALVTIWARNRTLSN